MPSVSVGWAIAPERSLGGCWRESYILGMSDPARSSAPPAPEPALPSLDRPTHRFPEGAFTPEELAVMDGIDPVDPAAALAWMLGEGPDPWLERSR